MACYSQLFLRILQPDRVEDINMDDISLVHQLKQGNQLAFTNLYKMYSAQAFSLAFK